MYLFSHFPSLSKSQVHSLTFYIEPSAKSFCDIFHTATELQYIVAASNKDVFILTISDTVHWWSVMVRWSEHVIRRLFDCYIEIVFRFPGLIVFRSWIRNYLCCLYMNNVLYCQCVGSQSWDYAHFRIVTTSEHTQLKLELKIGRDCIMNFVGSEHCDNFTLKTMSLVCLICFRRYLKAISQE